MVGEYSEKLQTGGTLKVTDTAWFIDYYFQGPDRRYNGKFIQIPGIEIDDYIAAWKMNFEKYSHLKEIILEGSYQTDGSMGMKIQIFGWSEGVCLRDYHMPVKTIEHLKQVVADYEYAKKRAHQIQELLSNLS